MTREQVEMLVENRRFPHPATTAEWRETHISWVILTPEWVYKIKKPVRFSFLDFSTPELRRHFCLEEVRLNQRLAPAMYVDVLALIICPDGVPELRLQADQPLDYAVRMHRMDDSRQMDRLLVKNEVTEAHMRQLAAQLAVFHQQQVLTKNVPYRAGDNRADFDDLFTLTAVVDQVFGPETARGFAALQPVIDDFLLRHEARLHERASQGFWVEGHGDLHARNIFLLPEGPLVFDCIEFNPHFRQLDVLNDLAFLCMDLEAGGHAELAGVFMQAYQTHWRCLTVPEDADLLVYFKAYRANVRLKVALLQLKENPDNALMDIARTYLALLERYVGVL